MLVNSKYDLYKLGEAERGRKVKVNKSQIARELGIKKCYLLFKKDADSFYDACHNASSMISDYMKISIKTLLKNEED